MSHFYRLKTINNASQSSNLTWSGKVPESSIMVDCKIAFAQGMEEVSINPPLPYCKEFKAPLIQGACIATAHIFKYNGKKAMPDIFGGGPELLVSERVKDIILDFDELDHQVLPVALLDRKKNIIPTEAPYFQINIRRFVEIENLEIELDQSNMEFPADLIEKRFLPTILANPTLFKYLAALPIWRHRQNESIVYLSEAMLHKLQQAGVTGLDPYRNYYGKPYDAIAKFKYVDSNSHAKPV